MTQRDRIVLIVAATLAILVAGWLMVVSPERKKASDLGTKVAAAQSALSSAEGELSNARAAQTQYASAYASIVEPRQSRARGRRSALADLPARTRVEQQERRIHVDLDGQRPAARAPPARRRARRPAGGTFTQMPFTFVFTGTFFDLEHLFEQLDRFTLRNASGSLQVSGRLLTIQSIKLTPLGTGGEKPGSGPSMLTGTITATAYILPASQGLTAGATPSSPAGASSATVSGSGSSSSPATPAVIQVTP